MTPAEILAKILVVEKALSDLKTAVMKADTPPEPITNPGVAAERAAKKICTYCNKPLDPPKPGKLRSDDRGAHHHCYKQVIRSIESGAITDEQAVTYGWLLPAKRGGRPPSKNSPAMRLMAAELKKSKS